MARLKKLAAKNLSSKIYTQGKAPLKAGNGILTTQNDSDRNLIQKDKELIIADFKEQVEERVKQLKNELETKLDRANKLYALLESSISSETKKMKLKVFQIEEQSKELKKAVEKNLAKFENFCEWKKLYLSPELRNIRLNKDFATYGGNVSTAMKVIEETFKLKNAEKTDEKVSSSEIKNAHTMDEKVPLIAETLKVQGSEKMEVGSENGEKMEENLPPPSKKRRIIRKFHFRSKK